MHTGTILSLFYVIVLIFSIMIHEVAHGIVAEQEGDPTARLLGRITLNPIKHIDWVGSIVLPLILVLSNAGFVVGWAKPVPYNPNNVRRGNKSIARIAISGVVANLIVAITFAILIRTSVLLNIVYLPFYRMASIIVLINLVLAFFNSIPLAPLDGFTLLQSLVGYRPRARRIVSFLEQWSLPLLIIFLVFGWRVVAPVIFTLFTALTGVSL